MSFLDIDHVSKTYPRAPEPCLTDFNLDVDRGEIIVLLGESGCGKTTILKVVAGLEEADAGEVRIDRVSMNGIAPEKRPIAMVFQKALLFKNMSVEQNVNFAPRVNRTMDKRALARKTEEMLELVGLAGLGKKKATELSGGQEQRVSLARALIVEPKLLLLDEPLSALDASLRESMQRHIRRLNQETGVTMLMVTHDQREAVAVADRIAVMHDGRVLQYAEPKEFYSRPSSRYVASFFGWKNFVAAERKGAAVASALGCWEIEGLDDECQRGLLAVRPEGVVHVGDGSIEGVVRSMRFEGRAIGCEIEAGGCLLDVELPRSAAVAEGDRVLFGIDPACSWFVADDGATAFEDDLGEEGGETR